MDGLVERRSLSFQLRFPRLELVLFLRDPLLLVLDLRRQSFLSLEIFQNQGLTVGPLGLQKLDLVQHRLVFLVGFHIEELALELRALVLHDLDLLLLPPALEAYALQLLPGALVRGFRPLERRPQRLATPRDLVAFALRLHQARVVALHFEKRRELREHAEPSRRKDARPRALPPIKNGEHAGAHSPLDHPGLGRCGFARAGASRPDPPRSALRPAPSRRDGGRYRD